MKVLLKQDVTNLGRAGDIKEVKTGYARNYLIPNGFVIGADARSEKEQLFLDNMRKRKLEKRKKTAEESASSLNGKEIRITVKTGAEGRLFGSVTNQTIQKALEEMGHHVDRKSIDLAEHIRQLGKYTVQLKLHEGVAATITVLVQDEEGNNSVASAPEAEEESQPAEESVETSSVSSDD